ncbi:lipocalin family protein [Aromatoleum diolicum]|uniref:Outer membrane lipoprotein Blc n=1 Tax=Aromatoleum diolicum TaxID=75796 RepID=A0ABX1QFY5_9RHOO|nr:lipocalin family protein [Aromatoleum diolicum]NMG77359.1 lipocalin [Aromatoleum diolicum]
MPSSLSTQVDTHIARTALFLLFALVLSACTTVPDGINPVSPFDIDRYLGKWYEIARLDHSFERGLTDVSANYRPKPDGSVEVVNRGYDIKKGAWREAVGRAIFIGERTRGSLKVSFFGPFYGGYHVAELDRQHYRWALVVGPNRDYVWILSRDKVLAPDIRQQLVTKAKQLGLDTERLIWVEHTRDDIAASAKAP